jgi:NAD-dependent dihydropyrimidine dehydrogenase PreA subunit
VQTIRMDDGRPVWGKDCTQCLACINRCPVHAIQYGKGTAQRGRYYHPDLNRLEKKGE